MSEQKYVKMFEEFVNEKSNLPSDAKEGKNDAGQYIEAEVPNSPYFKLLTQQAGNEYNFYFVQSGKSGTMRVIDGIGVNDYEKAKELFGKIYNMLYKEFGGGSGSMSVRNIDEIKDKISNKFS